MEVRKLVYSESYEKNGEKKTVWKECGVLFINEKGNISIKLSAFPLTGNIMAFPNKPKEVAPQKEVTKEDYGEAIGIDGLPF